MILKDKKQYALSSDDMEKIISDSDVLDENTKNKLYEEFMKKSSPLEYDQLIYRSSLLGVILISVGGFSILVYLSINGKQAQESIIALTSAALGALTGLLKK